MSKQSYKIKLRKINTFIFDVDGVLTDGKVLIDVDGQILRLMNTKDGYAMKYAIDNGFKISIITGGTNLAVKKRLISLGVHKIYLGSHNKINSFNDLIKKFNLNPNEILYVGDDIPDIPVMKKAGVSACPQDAVQEVKAISDYVSHKNGGSGCVREIIEQVLKVQGKWVFKN
jgi:3-deoxy-D-manno-octulosonate 8-phosphate phosphatase, YrbI family|tara:strand:+ start:909 stop:1424 length:516 start_codon:yes stop_codon:yes gene_type:complete